jgi:hypothetical protein
MATNTSKVFIDIITQFTGTKSVKQAETSFQKLAKSISKVVSVAAIEEFSRRSIKAFLADDAAAKQLEKTLTNLGVYFDSGVLSKYIQELQDTTGVLDDQLRPAFQSLAVATGDYTKAQDLLNTALDVSQATGKSLGAVSTALSRAYLGNYTAVSRLGAGISKAEIAAADFNAIQNKLNKNFGGSALAAADTYAGKVRILNAAMEDVKETIGKGFVDAFVSLTGPKGSATDFAGLMKSAALDVADLLRGLGLVAAKLRLINSENNKVAGGLFDDWFQAIPVLGSYLSLIKNVAKEQRLLSEGFYPMGPEPAQIGYAKATAAKKSLELAKKLAAEEKKKATSAAKAAKAAADKLKTEKANALLNAAAKVMDIDQAQILIALTRDISKEDKTRLLLQKALLDDNAEAAGKLAQSVLASQQAALLAEKTNPFGNWNDSLQMVLDSLKQMAIELAVLGAKAIIPSSEALTLARDAVAAIIDADDPSFDIQDQAVEDFINSILNAGTGARSGSTTAPSGNFTYGAGNPLNVNVYIDPRDLTTVVTSGQQNTTASGIVVGTSRINKYAGGA